MRRLMRKAVYRLPVVRSLACRVEELERQVRTLHEVIASPPGTPPLSRPPEPGRLARATDMPMETVLEKVNRVFWYHAFELVPGVMTPGTATFDARVFLDSLEVPGDLRGKRALDIGTWDGPAAFELEARGATVVGLDIQDPDQTGFNTAKEILRSKVQYVRGSVYELSQLLQDKFDIICYFGVYYHLKHPVLGFEEIAKVLAPNGQLLFEGECLRTYAETLEGKVSNGEGPDPVALGQCNLPLALCYPGHYKNTSNWFVPNFACLQSWMAATGLEIVRHHFTETPHPAQRISGIARPKAGTTAVQEHPLVGAGWVRARREQQQG